MTINFIDEINVDFDFDYETCAENVIKKTLVSEHFPYDIEVGLSFVDSGTIKKLNSDYRNIDKVTDVLSFPMIEYDDTDSIADTCSRYDSVGEKVGLINPDNNEVELGDIVLCVPKLYEQAQAYNHSVVREYAFLIAHSMLHLLGYDHIDDNERSVMEDKQNAILDDLGITRD